MAKASRQNTDTASIPGSAGSMAGTGTAGAASSVPGGAAAGPAASETSPAAIAAAQGAPAADPAPVLDVARVTAAEALAGRPEAVVRAAEDATGSALRAPGVGSGPASEPLVDTIAADLRGDTFVAGDPALRREMGTLEGGLTVEVGAATGIPPNLMSREGSFGGVGDRRLREDVGLVVDPEGVRHDLAGQREIARDLAMVSYTGAKLAAAMPKTREGIEALRAEGFDLVVIARQEGFRRAGIAHPAAATLRRSGDFTAAEIEALEAEPMLIVQALR